MATDSKRKKRRTKEVERIQKVSETEEDTHRQIEERSEYISRHVAQLAFAKISQLFSLVLSVTRTRTIQHDTICVSTSKQVKDKI